MRSIVTKNISRFSKFNINNNLIFKNNIKFFGSSSHAKSNHHDSHSHDHSHHDSHSGHGHGVNGHNEHAHGEHGHGEHGHDDHHGHHEITGEVDFNKIYVKNPKEVIIGYILYIINSFNFDYYLFNLQK